MKTKILIAIISTIFGYSAFSQTTTPSNKPISKIVYDGVYIQTSDLKYVEVPVAKVKFNRLCWQEPRRLTMPSTKFPLVAIAVSFKSSSQTDTIPITYVNNINTIVLKGIEFTDGSQEIFISPAQEIWSPLLYNEVSEKPYWNEHHAFLPMFSCKKIDFIMYFEESEYPVIYQSIWDRVLISTKKKSDIINKTITLKIDEELQKNKTYIIWHKSSSQGITKMWFFKII